MKTLGSFLIVELMRNGANPQEACEEAIARISKKLSNYKEIQVGYIALDKFGRTGAYSIQEGFEYAIYKNDKNELLPATSLIKLR
jgi:N4-(beta-N-acetylglucosaminyl)-L-asparaginase